jgi:hypothetical protein
MSQTQSIKKAVPFAVMVSLAFFIAGFVTYALFNGLTAEVYPPHYKGTRNWNLIYAWVGAWAVAGGLFGIYFGRK